MGGHVYQARGISPKNMGAVSFHNTTKRIAHLEDGSTSSATNVISLALNEYLDLS
jgi:hypothetical protein